VAVLGDWVSRRVSAQCLIGTLAVALLTLVCYRLHLNFSTVSFRYLIVVVLLSIHRWLFFIGARLHHCNRVLRLLLCSAVFLSSGGRPLECRGDHGFLDNLVGDHSPSLQTREMRDKALSSVRRKLIDAEERECTRIAKEISEDINQRVALVAFGLEQLGELEHTPCESVAEVNDHTRAPYHRVSKIGADLHAISLRLRSSNLE
jgi:hypothetical protein